MNKNQQRNQEVRTRLIQEHGQINELYIAGRHGNIVVVESVPEAEPIVSLYVVEQEKCSPPKAEQYTNKWLERLRITN